MYRHRQSLHWMRATAQRAISTASLLIGLMGTMSLVTLVAGCSSPDPIVTYDIPTKIPDELKPGKDRMLVLMLPRKEKVWFFKVRGPESAIQEAEAEFRSFVESVTFENEVPNLNQLPSGWRRGGEKAMRHASIDITTKSKQLDLSISSLPRPPATTDAEEWSNYVSLNVNRWRGQLGLEDSSEDWASGQPIEIASAQGDSVWVDLIGQAGASGAPMTPPFAGSARGPRTRPSPAPTQTASQGGASAKSKLKFDRPDGWRDGRMSSMRWAAFNVGPDESPAEVTVMPAGGDLRGNVVRWMGQVLGSQPDDEAVAKALDQAEEFKVDGREALRFLLTSDDATKETAIDATIIPMENGVNMFIKMTGPVATVKDQKTALTGFLDSLKF